MISEKSLVIYKNRPALVTAVDGDKLSISVLDGGNYKVRNKDIELLHTGPCTKSDLESPAADGNVREVWELMQDSEDAGGMSVKEFAELLYGKFTPRTALAVFQHLQEELYFTGGIKSIKARPREIVEIEENKRKEKQREVEEKNEFFLRLKKLYQGKAPEESALSESDRRYLYDVEALARCLTDKSRTLKELNRSETPQEAHRLLLATGLWNYWDNPYPYRFGQPQCSSKIIPDAPPEDDRLDLSHLTAYAVDNEGCDDPDDAISLEGPDKDGRYTLWVHVADPAAAVLPGSPADLEANGRGTTLYIPEGSVKMLAPELTMKYALFPREGDSTVPALSIKILLNKDISIAETSMHLSRIKVTRLSYDEADNLALNNGVLSQLFVIADRSLNRRINTGGILIELPEVKIELISKDDKKEVRVEPIIHRKSADMVRECMIMAGEACAAWALKNRLPFAFISQEEGELPPRKDWLSGLAGAWQLRRAMRPRSVSPKPGVHWGLGLDLYSQVTSPLRRYTDLLCHQQIRSFLKQAPVLTEDELSLRLGAAEAGAAAAVKAERCSRLHWLAVYLSDKKNSHWEGIALDIKGSRAAVFIPSLGLETQINIKGKCEPNDKLDLIFLSAKIPELEIIFALSP